MYLENIKLYASLIILILKKSLLAYLNLCINTQIIKLYKTITINKIYINIMFKLRFTEYSLNLCTGKAEL